MEARPIQLNELQEKNLGESSRDLRQQVMKARKMQERRYKGTGFLFNSDLAAKDIAMFCPLGEKEEEYMEKIYHSLQLSARAYHRIIKVARTIADLEECEKIEQRHLSEAVCFKGWEI